MAYNENYGFLPQHVLSVVKRFNVSPSDYDTLCAVFDHDMKNIHTYIILHSDKGYYAPPFPVGS